MDCTHLLQKSCESQHRRETETEMTSLVNVFFINFYSSSTQLANRSELQMLLTLLRHHSSKF